MRIANWSLPLGVALSTTAYGVATTAGTDFDPSLDMGRYSTFGWDEDAIPQSSGERLDEASPELLVHYHVSVEDHVGVFEARGRPVDPRLPTLEHTPGTEVIQYEQGSLVIHFVDAGADETLWVGWAQGDVGPALTDSERMREWVDGALAKMFEDFPVRRNASGS